MKHRIQAKHLNRDSNSRKALFKSLLSALIQSGEIQTTEPKAKAVKGLVDKVIHRAQEGSVNTRRILARFFGRRDVVNELVDKVAPSMKDRTSGFTRIVRIGRRRGDNTMLVKMELINNPHKENPLEKKEVKAQTVEPQKEKKKVEETKTQPDSDNTKKTAAKKSAK